MLEYGPMTSLILIGSLAALASAGLVAYSLSRRPKAGRRPYTGASFDLNLSPALERELQKLALPKDKLPQALQTVSAFVDQELHKKTTTLRNEIYHKYDKMIREKDTALSTAETKINELSAEFKKASRARRQTETVVKSLAEGRVIVDREGRALQVDAAAEKLLGRKKEDIIGKPVASLHSPAQVISMIQKLADQEEETVTTLSEDPSVQKLLRASSAVIETDTGEARGMISVLPELTKTREVDTYKSEFLAGITHELRAPLVCIQKSLEAMLEESSSPQERRHFLDIAARNTAKLTEFVNQILDFSKLESGGVKLHVSLFPASELVRETRDHFAAWAVQKNIRLTVDAAEGTQVIEADRARLGQVLSNLVSNALKFTPPGGKIELGVRLTAPAAADPRESGPAFEFWVRDTGPGIAAHEQTRIFEKFARGSAVVTGNEDGTGLGLAIARTLVDAHRGRLWVESTSGQGSTFWFTVPQYRA